MENELENITAAILAAEDWAEEYDNAPKQHAQLIKLNAKLYRLMLVFFRDLAKHAPDMVNWYNYTVAVNDQQLKMQQSAIEAYDVNVVVNNQQVQNQDQQFIKVVFDTVASATNLGVASAEVEHGLPIGLNTTSEIIQKMTTKQLANLVGMKVQKDGTIVTNPNAAYNIDDTTRSRIARSIKTSIQLGEKHSEAVKRLQNVIADPERASMIADTETVRAYGSGRAIYAKQAGARGKYNSDSNATDYCADNTGEGIIPADADFLFGGANEPFHPRCRCIVSYTYGDPIDG